VPKYGFQPIVQLLAFQSFKISSRYGHWVEACCPQLNSGARGIYRIDYTLMGWTLPGTTDTREFEYCLLMPHPDDDFLPGWNMRAMRRSAISTDDREGIEKTYRRHLQSVVS
jgi:hypothetical protein